MAARSTPPVLLSCGLAGALAERARLHPVPARGHLAPAPGVVLGGVVESPATVRIAARLHPAPTAVAHRSEHGGEHLAEGAVDAVRDRLDPPRRVVVERGDDLGARRSAVEQLDRI